MFGVLALLFLVVPILEIYVITQVAGGLGWLTTILAVIAVSVFGAWMVRFQGVSVMIRVQRRLREGRMPGKELVDGALILVAGALLLTPGFLTDGVGLLLLFPPTRLIARTWLTTRYRRGVEAGRYQTEGGAWGGRQGTFYGRWTVVDADVVDADVVDQDPPIGPPTGELGRDTEEGR